MEPQYTTADMPSAISRCPMLTKASKTGLPSGPHGVINAGMTPVNTGLLITFTFWFAGRFASWVAE